MSLRLNALLGVIGLGLAACSSDTGSNDASDTPPETAAAEEQVTRQEVEQETAPVTRMAEATVIQSQPGPDGSQVDLTRVP